MSSISSLSSSFSPIQISPGNGFGQSLTALQSALQSGNLSTAQTAFSSLLNLIPGSTSVAASTSSGGGNSISSDLQSLQSAIQSGNVNAAQAALTNLTAYLQGSKGHGHHHHRSGGSLANDLLNTTGQSQSSSTADLLNAADSTSGSSGNSVNYLA